MINKNKFDEFVNSTEEKKENKIDWNERLKTWKDNLNELYKNVEEWCYQKAKVQKKWQFAIHKNW